MGGVYSDCIKMEAPKNKCAAKNETNPVEANEMTPKNYSESTSDEVKVGFRVIRGPDWMWGDQDGGEGHVGTIVEVGHAGNRRSPYGTVIVQWDNGKRTNYRVGYKGAYDLLLLDGAPAGVKHTNKRCDGCGRKGIKGVRWQCMECNDYDLCTRCYMNETHDPRHKFRRFLHNNSIGVVIPNSRAESRRQHASGIFPGAKVVRGCDWIWGNQDGGEGREGTVTDIRGWQDESERSVASVNFPTGSGTNVYRVGHRGKVDLRYAVATRGPSYYKDHLPVVGNESMTVCPFSVGDRVRVCLSVEVLKQMQQNHGGWNPRMAQLIGLVGRVHRITQQGDVRVQYPPLTPSCRGSVESGPSSASENNRWTINAAALTRYEFNVDDRVRVIEDGSRVRSLQSTDHGSWNAKMTECLGKTGVIIATYPDGDVRVEFPGQTQWTFNPACLVVTTGETPIIPPEPLVVDETKLSVELAQKIAAGDVQGVEDILQEHPSMINARYRHIGGRTGLQVAAYRGQAEIVRLLLSKGASMSIVDVEGDGALHYAMFSKSPADSRNKCMRLLLDSATNSDVNLLNQKRQSPLHVAVIKGNLDWARTILQLGGNVNAQDYDGDTATHCCIINLCKAEMLRLLLSQANFDPALKNSKGFNILHTAAQKDKKYAVELILEKFPSMASEVKSDGLTPLHLSVLNEHESVTALLIEKCPRLIDLQDNFGQTPLYVAASEGLPVIVSMLVQAGADTRVRTKDGKCCVDAALDKHVGKRDDIDSEVDDSMPDSMLDVLPTSSDWSEIRQAILQCGDVMDDVTYLGIACYLLRAVATQNPDDTLFVRDIVTNVRDERTRNVLMGSHSLNSMSIRASDFSDLGSGHMRRSVSSQTSVKNYVKALAEDFCYSAEERRKCKSCGDEAASVEFKPCGHKIVCAECCVRMKKCIQCEATIVVKVDECGNDISLLSVEQQEHVLELERQVRELRESNQCVICMENERDTALRCGHRFCQHCARTMRKQCPICRRPITGTIHLYN